MRNGFYLIILTPVFCTLLLLIGGCAESQKAKQANQQDEAFLAQKQLENANEKLIAENARLKEEITSLTNLDESLKYDAITRLSRIELTRRCGLYDSDKDNVKDDLRIYLRTIDDIGDAIKAAGSCEVELWNLNAEPSEALIGKWQAGAETLKKAWSGTFMTNYFKLEFDLNGIETENGEFTLKVKFNDHLTGKVLTTQRQLK
ncbi:MAG: hypothetical protein K8R02_00280 [Anaerohalosphaeraceae bacterium]|nr:hypothetical protein [Anaerohalosphaeraceae bacterium]